MPASNDEKHLFADDGSSCIQRIRRLRCKEQLGAWTQALHIAGAKNPWCQKVSITSKHISSLRSSRKINLESVPEAIITLTKHFQPKALVP